MGAGNPPDHEPAAVARFDTRWKPGKADTACLVVSGDVDLETADHLYGALVEAMSGDGLEQIDVDMGGVRLLSAAGIAVLLAARHEARSSLIGFRVTGASGIAKRALEITGVADLLGGGS